MKLLEYEAKSILQQYDIEIPSRKSGSGEFVVKAQLPLKNRMEKGAVVFAESLEEAKLVKEDMMASEFGGIKPSEVIIEDAVDINSEYYVSFLYDTDVRAPVMLFSAHGGTGIEENETEKLNLNSEEGEFQEFLEQQGFEEAEELAETLQKLYKVFLEEDARLLEINPLAETNNGYVAVDAMIDLEDDASFRHERDFPERDDTGREKTERELRAEKIDEDDHRGVAGKYTELDGDIAMMLAGGGASLTNMDAMIEAGGEPANYTEYGGNPPEEKVYRLSKVIMDKPRLRGLWHVGGTANNTDIYRTMKGFCRALREEEPDYPIVIRRDGPNADRAFEMLREVREELDLDMKLYRNDTPMTETAEVLMEMIENE